MELFANRLYRIRSVCNNLLPNKSHVMQVYYADSYRAEEYMHSKQQQKSQFPLRKILFYEAKHCRILWSIAPYIASSRLESDPMITVYFTTVSSFLL